MRQIQSDYAKRHACAAVTPPVRRYVYCPRRRYRICYDICRLKCQHYDECAARERAELNWLKGGDTK